MKRLRRNAEETTADTATAEPVAEERKSGGLLRECWADLRGRPRPTAEVSEPEFEPNRGVGGPGTGGIGIDDEGIARMRRRYESSTH